MIGVMDEIGIDLSDGRRRQLEPDMVDQADRIVAFLDPQQLPPYLAQDRRVLMWADIPNPGGHDLAFHREVREMICMRVDALVQAE